MKRHWLVRALCMALCACLWPLFALGEQEPVITETQFDVSVTLDASAFPQGASSRLKDWQTFLSKLSLRGKLDSQAFWAEGERRRYDAALCVNGKETLPFVLNTDDQNYWLTSPAVAGETLFFNMFNYYEFMLKPYYFMGLPTNRLAFLLWPYGDYYMADLYYRPIADAIAGEGTRVVPYETLSELALSLDNMYFEDWANYPAHFVLALLVDLEVDDLFMDIETEAGLTELENWLDYLDPEQQGMTITVSGSGTRSRTEYAIGGQRLLTVQRAGDATVIGLRLQNEAGFGLRLDYDYTPAADGARLTVTLATLRPDGSTGFVMTAQGAGLPIDGLTSGEGTLRLTMGGLRLGLEAGTNWPFDFTFGWQSDAAQCPVHTDLWLSYLHPQTGRAAVTVRAALDSTDGLSPSVFDGESLTYANDVFGVNSGSLTELKSKVKLPLVLSMVPVVLEAPAGVLNDVVELMKNTGVLSALGVE